MPYTKQEHILYKSGNCLKSERIWPSCKPRWAWLQPLKQKLTLVLEHMSPEDAKKATGILHHIKVIDIYSQVTKGLMAGVIIAGCLTQGV